MVVLWDILSSFSVLTSYKRDDDCKTVEIYGNQVICGYQSGSVTIWPIVGKDSKTSFKNISSCICLLLDDRFKSTYKNQNRQIRTNDWTVRNDQSCFRKGSI